MIVFKPERGRLATLQFVPPLTLEETKQLVIDVRKHIAAQTGGVRVIILTDIRSSVAFPQDVIELLIRVMTADNPAIEKNGILYSPGGSMGLQVTRAIRDAKSEDRRFATDDRKKLLSWFEPSLSADEQALAHAFYQV